MVAPHEITFVIYLVRLHPLGKPLVNFNWKKLHLEVREP
jgi:hypothetical protein